MTTTDTNDVKATIDQVMRCADAGADLVRITVQGKREAIAAGKIRDGLFKLGYQTPLVADIHFQPKVALMVADAFEKIRINPGNFVDGRKTFKEMVYESQEEFDADIPVIAKELEPLVIKCRDLGRAMRIGTNHGSLSARVLSFYGDTPRGMVESAVEFAKICRGLDYHNFVFSMKASNPLVMVQAYRLLAAEQYKLGWDYPLHLGVTEAGEGEDGRMKSAIGIGSLLQDGLGDTIRVSLTEDPEFEIEPCRTLAGIGRAKANDVEACKRVPTFVETKRNFESFSRRRGDLPWQRESDKIDVRGFLHRDGSVLAQVDLSEFKSPDRLYKKLGCKLAVGMPFKDVATVDSILLREIPSADDKVARTALRRLLEVGVGVIAPIETLRQNPLPNSVAIVDLDEYCLAGGKVDLPEGAIRTVISVKGTESEEALLALSKAEAIFGLFSVPDGVSRIHASRRVFEHLEKFESTLPIIHHMVFPAYSKLSNDQFILTIGSEVGAALVDGQGDGVLIEAHGMDLDSLRLTSFGLLQGSRMRNTKTEYVSCPSCGRTLFDLQEVTQQIQEKTGHLPGVSVAIMGCIVNGVGEMADADFGYVGGAPGKVDLYVGKEVVKRGIPNELACDALIDLIKQNGRWKEKEEEEEMAEVVVA
eukprot:CAMPEP_0171462690 /NCGR_PEP_ID=MMETSP0945-20130129/6622_1 /TAXON_ID=109269 /ORGANISM="Vaucheria litorea, Strain CCMP2940" /LENGTH=646 /DNA_ID=CAMNT_0011989257 /DNA_START=287 /DNA_END=2227 /DNA_ORIENTATION=-